MAVNVSMKLCGELDYLRLVWQTVEGVMEAVTFPEDEEQTKYNILLGVQEALTNILKHGYGDRPGPVWVMAGWEEDQFLIELMDEAPEFDPTKAGGQPDTENGSSLPEGGYGIQIIRAVMDGIHYKRENGRNTLTLSKALTPVVGRI